MPNRYFVKHLLRRKNPDGLTSIYCQKCGREIMRAVHPTIGSVNKCAICVMKAEGVENPEDHVLAQYRMSPTGFPMPLDYDDSTAGGVLLLNPDEVVPEGEQIPLLGVMGTVRAAFRAFGFGVQRPVTPAKSVQLATEKRSGLFGPQKSRR